MYRTGQVVQKLLVFAALIPLLFFTACPNLNDEPDNPTVTGVTVSPTTATVAKGRTQQFTAAVSGDNNPAQTVTWTVEGGGTGTSISAGGLLSVGANETAATLTVKATSTVDTSKSGTASVTVSSSGQTPGVTVSPATPNVVKGTTQQFTATVSGTTAQTVTWTVEGGGDGTGISAGGLLSVGANETATTLTVKATSTADPSKFGTATVTVYASTDELPSVSNVTVSPTTATVPKGGTRQFTAVVSGTTAQTVTWTVEGNGDGTSISAGGLLSVGANETAASLTVRATSTVDTSKSGTASVTVEGEILTSIADVQAYLSAASGGGTAADPVSLNVQLDLGDTANGWTALLDAIQTAGKFVALDLSASTLSGTEYDPGAANTGESKILSLVLPNGAASIKGGSNEINSSFKNFTALTSVSGSAVETIGDYAFASCASLTAVSFPAATDIGHFAFYDCDALTTVSLPAVSSIGEHAFRDCAALTTVSLPAVTSINYRAFASCTALTAVNLPATLTTISVNPFAGCINLATITVASGNPNYSAQNGMLLNKTGTTLIAYPGATGAVTLNTVSSIGSSAFQGCTSLTTVSLPAAVSIDSSVFTGCTSLAELSLPAATSIGAQTFGFTGTGALTVTLGSTPPTLGDYMFANVNTAKTVTVKVPSSATGYGALPSTYSSTDSTPTWGNGFRGKGWNGSGFLSSGSINSRITVTIQAQ